MAKLNQIIAVANGKKSRTEKGLTELYHQLQKAEPFSGIARTYRPKNEDGDQLPPERKNVQIRVRDVIKEACDICVDLFDVIATQDFANCEARADIVVDGKSILSDVPVTHLLFLEKKLTDVHSFAEKLPTLDPAYEWEWSQEADCWATRPAETTRTKKVPRAFVKYDATKEHPAQVEVFNEDEIVGYWSKIDFSGAIPAQEKREIITRIRKLQDAVKAAREEANCMEIVQREIGENLLRYIFP